MCWTDYEHTLWSNRQLWVDLTMFSRLNWQYSFHLKKRELLIINRLRFDLFFCTHTINMEILCIWICSCCSFKSVEYTCINYLLVSCSFAWENNIFWTLSYIDPKDRIRVINLRRAFKAIELYFWYIPINWSRIWSLEP